MNQLIVHPEWCRRADCASTGSHQSATFNAGRPGDLVGVDATLVELETEGIRMLRLTITEEGTAAHYSVPVEQARALSDVITSLLDV